MFCKLSLKEFAPGIPKKGKITDPPPARFEIWEGGIQEHLAERAGPHIDIRLGNPKTGIAHSWAVNKIPSSGEKVRAFQTFDHNIPYMEWQGIIEEGYGKGKVRKIFRGKIELLKSEPGKISFNLYKGKNTFRLHLIKTNFGWILYNTTLTTKSRPDVPLSKPKYKHIKLDKIDMSNVKEVFAPKIDGAHNIIAFRKDKPIEVTSYRPSVGEAGIIDHSFRTDLYKIIPPKELHNTLVRVELFGVSKKGKVLTSTQTAGLLNSEVWKTRASGNKLGNVIFDVIKFKGKDVSDRPYKEKLEMLREITDNVPGLYLPPLAFTIGEKTRMMAAIQSGKNPLTKEGIIIYDLEKSVPLRGKLRKDIDVYVSKTYLGKGRLAKKMVGGFYASRKPGGEPIIRVGGGLSDKLRKEMYKRPGKFIGRTAKIYIQDEYPSGKVRAPIFKEWRETA